MSVISVFRNRKEWIEQTLKALYTLDRIPCEFFFIDDASTDGSTNTIHSLLEYYQHDQTFFFEQEASRGRGNSLNSALEQVRGRILWIPELVDTVSQKKLAKAIKTLISSEAAFAIATDDSPPENSMDWLQLLQNERLPFDRNYLFDLHKIRPGRRFTDPHWTTRHASEWAIRLHAESDPITVAPFSAGESNSLAMDDRSKKECVLALLRIPDLSLSGQEKAFRLLRSYGQTDFEEEKESLEHLYQEAHSLYKTGNGVNALELLNRILAIDRYHKRARSFKVRILEKMRRYVEAAEVKHGYDPNRARSEKESEPDLFSASETGERSEAGSGEIDPDEAEAVHQTDPETGSTDEPEAKTTDKPEDRVTDDSETGPKSDPETEPPDESGAGQTDEPETERADEPGPRLTDDPETGPADESGAGQTDEQETERADEPRAGTGDIPGNKSGSKAPATTSKSTLSEELRHQPSLTVIIPTATNRRTQMEKCLTSVFRYTSPDHTRVIVIDNASVDDTGEYLDKLLKSGEPLTVLTNEQNTGFAAAVNQGLAKAGDGPVVVMHNDVVLDRPVPGRLARKLEQNPDIGLIVPRTDHTWNRLQRLDSTENETQPVDEALTEVDYADGFCMAFRNEKGLTMNKKYGLAFFDDADFCLRMQKKGYRVVIDNRESVHHLGGMTTGDLGLTMRSKKFWKNSALFHKEWSIEPQFPAEHTGEDPLRQFVLLGRLINPFYPEKHLLAYFSELFTSEEKTRVYNTEFPSDALKSMIRLMMASNQRDILRRLEQQLDTIEIDEDLYHDLIVFYYDRTIYSRCKLYFEKLGYSKLPVDLALYQLKVAIGEKDYIRAAELLKELMSRIPSHPDVLLSAAEIHRKNGNREQSEKFAELAKTFNPYIES